MDIQLYTKISALPGSLKKEVADFIDFLIYRKKKAQTRRKRMPGLAKGRLTIKDNFDDPIEGFKDYE